MTIPSADIDENVAIRLRYATCSDVGMRREENQDSFGVFDHGADSLFVVADGMGGVRGGAIASQLAIKIFTEMTANKDSFTAEDLVEMAKKANIEIYEHGIRNPDYAGMGTTAVGLCFHQGQLLVMNVGDSRAYRIRGQEIVQLTEDHTLVSELIKAGTLTEDQRENHPVSHMLTRSLGPTPTVDVDCAPTESVPQIGDKYLLCSDGLYNMVKSPQLQYIVSNYSANEAARMLIDTANRNGGSDNITCIVIEVLSAQSELEEDEDINSGLNSFSTVGTLELSEPLDFIDEEQEEEVQDPDIDEPEESASVGDQSFVMVEEPNHPVFESKIAIDEVASNAHEARKDPIQEKRSIISSGGYLVFAAFCLIIGLIYGERLSHSGEIDDEQLVKSYQQSMPVVTNVERTPVLEETITPIVEEALNNSAEEIEENDALEQNIEIPDYTKIAEKKVIIRERIDKIKEKLNSLEGPITEAAASLLNKCRKRIRKIDNILHKIKEQKEEQEIKKEEWMSRATRMKRETVQHMATEISRYSGEVDEVWLDYQGYVRKYIKVRENAKFSDDENKENEVKIVEQGMHNKLEEVRKTINSVIKREIKTIDENIQKLISRKIELEEEKSEMKKDIDYSKAILSGDPKERAVIKTRLEQDLNDLESELAGYLQLLPDAEVSNDMDIE